MTPTSPPKAIAEPPGHFLTGTIELAEAAPVLQVLEKHVGRLLELANQVYRNDTSHTDKKEQPNLTLGKPLHGSYHVLVLLEIDDGAARYLLKVPFNGTKERWDSLSERALDSEAQTMKLLSKTIPVPTVHTYSATLDNSIGCPYIIISYVEGLPLYDVWFGHQLRPTEISAEVTQQARRRALDGIACAMVNLGQFSFSEAGGPVFNSHGGIAGIGATRVVNAMVMMDPTTIRDSEHENSTLSDENSPRSDSGMDSSGAGQQTNVGTDGTGGDTAECGHNRQAPAAKGVFGTLKRGLAAMVHGATWVSSHLSSLVGLGWHSNQRGKATEGALSETGNGSAALDHSAADASRTDGPAIEDDIAEDVIYADYTEWGPTADPKQYYTRSMDLFPEEHPYPQIVEMFLRKLISWMPEPEPSTAESRRDPLLDGRPFVFAHPDFDIQNFIVGEDGTLRAIIDWDGVAAVPRSVGNEVLPGWLTRDWDPSMYAYVSEMGDEEALLSGYEPATLWEDSEESLSEYRGIYADLVAEHKRRYLSGLDLADEQAAGEPLVTRRSLVADSLYIAASNPISRSDILMKIVSEMWEAYRDVHPEDNEPVGDGESESECGSESDLYPTFYDIAQLQVEGEVTADLLCRLEEAFAALLQRVEKCGASTS